MTKHSHELDYATEASGEDEFDVDSDELGDSDDDLDIDDAESGVAKRVELDTGRKPVQPPAVITPGMSLYDYLRNCTPPLDNKLIEISCSQTHVGYDLRDDARQEIIIMWSGLKPDTKKYRPGQIAAYAHGMARHTALRLRRDMGSAVRLPGSAFRKRRDGSSYITPGLLAETLDWTQLEQWYSLRDGTVDSSYLDNHSMPASAELLESALVQQESEQVNEEEAAVQARLRMLDEVRAAITDQQYRIMKALIEGATFEDIMRTEKVKRGTLIRDVSVVSSIIGPDFIASSTDSASS